MDASAVTTKSISDATMKPTRVALIGGGENARVIVDAMRSRQGAFEIVGFVDPDADAPLSRDGIAHLGNDADVRREMLLHGVIAMGAQKAWRARLALARELDAQLHGWASVVHSAAWVSPSAAIGAGSVVMAGSVVQAGARLGQHCIVNTGAVVEHDVVLESNVHIAPGAVIGGGVTIGESCYVGMGASIRNHIDIGAESMIGMGSVVIRSMKPKSVVRSVPATRSR
jgi:acetyltransferase EpsM